MATNGTKRSSRRPPVVSPLDRRAIDDPTTSGPILIVDDEEIVRGMLVWLFEEAGYVVREAVDGGQALEALADDPPACMILDLMMPGVDGQTVLQRRQEQDLAPDTRIVVLTAKTAPSDEVWCWERGADEFLTKPFDADQLLKLVGDLMSLTVDQLRHRREVGLADARRLDALEAALKMQPRRRR
jgi:DNA-binding response OmpR family regulator